VLEPCYDSYVPNIELAGGTVVRVPLQPGTFRPDFARIAAALTPRTRALLVNSPHNPSATVWTRGAALCRSRAVNRVWDHLPMRLRYNRYAQTGYARG